MPLFQSASLLLLLLQCIMSSSVDGCACTCAGGLGDHGVHGGIINVVWGGGTSCCGDTSREDDRERGRSTNDDDDIPSIVLFVLIIPDTYPYD